MTLEDARVMRKKKKFFFSVYFAFIHFYCHRFKMGLLLSGKAQAYLFPPPSVWDLVCEIVCCPVVDGTKDLIEDEKTK